MVVTLESYFISTEELWSTVRLTIGFLVTSMTKTKAIHPRLLSLDGWPALGSILVVPNFFHLRMMEATVFLGTFNAVEIFWYPSPDLYLDTILSRSSYVQYLRLHGLVLSLTCTCQLWDLIQTGVCLSKSLSNQLNLPQVDSNEVVETSQGWSMETECT